ncbi:PQQ-dependent sugar dehydrogenase [Salegentibacter sp. F188]|uniref:PQQ-dependent sugar dehydrogenase n=1 Tax=Autumnicola patrickiae TaxID=3075591 RepID=A0ABU3E666_9FLAO|nr:PQQ-dependent sugar dehydrogenase [Salegentibacter sp. F188]MDT0691486.1 PQQ-dependent sugar dehydrogenase [Salegentibacter sp. F188]
MKKIILLLAILCTALIQAQDKGVISEEKVGHIYKPERKEATESRINSLSKPEGFKITKFAEGLGEPRMLAVSEAGNVYVTRRAGDVMMFKDADKDGKAEFQETVVTKEGAHGIAIKDNTFYLITVNDIFKAEINNDGSIGELEKFVENLPDGGQHPNRTIRFAPNGELFVSVGSTCNACPETREENATMLRVDPETGERTIFAKGLRNTIGFDWHPESGALFGMDHGIDWLGDDDQKEELNKIEEGGNYGWPYVYEDGKANKSDEPPNNLSWEEYAKETTFPQMLFTAHSAPMDFIFYRGDMFPSEYRNKALLTFHGSWNRKPASGYKLMTVDFENGEASQSEDFITGFLTEEGTARFGRPVGLVELQDGSVLFSDDQNGIIYRISYQK